MPESCWWSSEHRHFTLHNLRRTSYLLKQSSLDLQQLPPSCLQEQQAAALLTGPSDVPGASSQALADAEKEHLVARIQQLEAAGHQGSADWQRSLNGDDERRR